MDAGTYACLEQDLIDPAFFARGGGAIQSDPVASTQDASTATGTSGVPTGELSGDPRGSDPTAYINAVLRWTERGTKAKMIDGKLVIPVCWINPDPSNREGRELTKRAVRAA